MEPSRAQANSLSMTDNDLFLRIPHALGETEAKRRIASGVDAAKLQYGKYISVSDLAWDANRLDFRVSALAQTVTGSVDVYGDYVELRAQLPLVIRLLAKRFMPVVQNTGQKMLE